MSHVTRLKANFKNKKLLALALTHKSWVNEHAGGESNERLEFLGDAVLEFVVSEELYKKFPEKEEGYLTALRANLVNTTNLSEIAKSLKVSDGLRLSKGEEEGGGRDNPSILANTFEAIIGALFLDGGITAAEDFIQTNILTSVAEKVSKPLKDAKSRLQELVQAKGFPSPRYMVVEETGPDHAKSFTIEVLINGKPTARGIGKNKSEAQQEAAEEAIKSFG